MVVELLATTECCRRYSLAHRSAAVYGATMTAADLLRDRLATAVRSVVGGSSEPRPVAKWDPTDPPLIDMTSPVRTVHADPAMFVGGVRSLLYQTLHPTTMFAVSEHSDYRNDPLGRLHRTAHFLGATTFGAASEARQAIEVVRAIHGTVTGVTADGKPYRADDPHLLGWVHATEVDSFLRSHQRYGTARLSTSDRDAYVADMAPIGEALGVRDAPRSTAELRARLAAYRPELASTRQSRETTRFLFAPPLPRATLPFYALIFGAAVGLLPRHARAMLMLPLAPGVDPLVLRPATTALTRTLRWAMTSTSAGR